MAAPCRYDRYEIVAAQLEGQPEFSVDICENPATHTALVERAGDGLAVRVDVDVCLIHDDVLSAAPGWKTSIKKRIT